MSESTIRFSAVGDVSFGDHPLCVGFGTHSKLKNKPNGFAFEHVQKIFDGSDLIFGNLECTLSESNKRSNDYNSVQMRGHNNYIHDLVRAGFNVMNMANNHSMQHGEIPFIETTDTLRNNKILPVGLKGNNSESVPVIKEVNGISVAFLGYSLRPRQYFEQAPLYKEGNIDIILDDISKIKDKVDNVIISLHWGDEFIQRPSPEEINLARNAIDAGANLIIGHHPHVLRGIEKYNNGYIAYSLGNFVCDMLWDNSLRETGILSCEISKNGIENIHLVPAFINKYYQPDLLVNGAADKLLKDIKRLSKEVALEPMQISRGKVDEYQQDADSLLLVIRKKSQLFFIRNVWRYSPFILSQQLIRYFLNRIHEFTNK